MQSRRTVIAAAAALAFTATLPAYAGLERMGPVDHSPSVGGYPAWFQDSTGIAIEFCNLSTQAEWDGGWCVLIPPDGPAGGLPEVFPNNYFDEHFYFIADNGMTDKALGVRARLVIALEAAFANGPAADGDQMVFARHRVFIPTLPFDGDYRVVTPYSDITYYDQVAGDRIFETSDIGTACIATFECALNGALGPFLLPSKTAGGAEVPPMPDLIRAPVGTDPWFDAMLAGGVSPTADPGTGKQYLADPGRIGTITGSPLPDFEAFETDGSHRPRNHNTFRIEVRAPDPNHNGAVIYTMDGETNFVVNGRLMTQPIPGNVTGARGSYKADLSGKVTDLDIFAHGSPTLPSRLPTQPIQPRTTPVLNAFDQPCGGALGIDPVTKLTVINPGPYTAPVGASYPMAATGGDYWTQVAQGQTPAPASVGKLPPSHVCVEDLTARNTAGQVVPTYTLAAVTDEVTITAAEYNGPSNGTLSVRATSSDPTAVMTLAGFGPSHNGDPAGTSTGKGAGLGLEFAGTGATVTGLLAPPSNVQVTSTRGGSDLSRVKTVRGGAVMTGVPTAGNVTASMNEDCSATAATACPSGQGVVVDLLANSNVLLNGVSTNLRTLANSKPGSITINTQAPRLGTIVGVNNGFLTFQPLSNANGTDNVAFTATVNGQTSNLAVASITINPINDKPATTNLAGAAVVSKLNSLNLLANASDPDGLADVKEAVIATWPTNGLGAKPTPLNGVIKFTPTATGTFNFTFQVRDAAGLVSSPAIGSVTVMGSETITYTKVLFVAAGNVGGASSTRWTVTGTDSVRAKQTLTLAYNDGSLKSGGSCNGTATPAACVIGTVQVDAIGNWSFDQVGSPGGPTDPTDLNTWAVLPKNIRTFSSNPNLGGGATTAIVFK